jgi:hypothetical protein
MEDLNKKISDCVKARTKRDLTPNGLLAMSFAEQKEFLKKYSECYFEELGKISRTEFEPWFDEKVKDHGSRLEADGKWLLSYLTQVGLPSETITQIVQLGISLEVTDSKREYMWNPDIAPKFLGLTLIQWVEQLRVRLKLQPLQDLQTFSKNYLNLDSNWILVVIILVIEELLVRKKLKELEVSVDKRESFPMLCEKLIESLDSSGSRPSCEVLKSKGRREIRNRVLHRGDNPTEDETFRLMGEVRKLAHDLWPKKIESQ